MRQGTLQKNPQISLLKIMHPEILVVLYIHGHVYENIHWIIFVTTSNSAFKSRKQIYIHEIKIQKYHYFNQCIWRFDYHTSNTTIMSTNLFTTSMPMPPPPPTTTTT